MLAKRLGVPEALAVEYVFEEIHSFKAGMPPCVGKPLGHLQDLVQGDLQHVYYAAKVGDITWTTSPESLSKRTRGGDDDRKSVSRNITHLSVASRMHLGRRKPCLL